jgi:hypothetical protein
MDAVRIKILLRARPCQAKRPGKVQQIVAAVPTSGDTSPPG